MKILIVGGVAGGAGTAARLRRNDEYAEIIMFEKDEFISFANCGLPYYIGDVIKEKSALQINTPQHFSDRYNVDVRVFSEVIGINVKEKTVTVKNVNTGEEYIESYDKLVLSPGAAPIRPPIEGVDAENVFTIRNIADTYAIKEYIDNEQPKTAVVVGGGFIGVEMADNLRRAGLQVSIVEKADHLVQTIDEDMSYDVHNHLREKGITLYLQQTVTDYKEKRILLNSGKQVQADMVILSVGVKPLTNFLKDSGIPLGDKGEILVNEYFETDVQDVYALGDAVAVPHLVTGKQVYIPLAGPANKQARVVADNITGKRIAYAKSQGTAVLLAGDMTVATLGLTEKQLKEENIPYKKALTFSQNHAGYYPGAKPMFIKLLFSSEGKIYGAQITGYEGVDKRIDVLAMAQRTGATIKDLTEVDLAYAPPFGSAKDPVNMIGYVAENILEDRTKQFFLEDIANIPENAFLLDCRTPAEYEAGHIEGFLNLELDDLRNQLEFCPKDTPVYITCRVGMRGYLAEQILIGLGYNTYNFAGGYRIYEAYIKDKEARK